MIVHMRSKWHMEMSMPTLITLRNALNEMLHQMRSARKSQIPIFTCQECGFTTHGASLCVSVRAMIPALARFGIASKDQAKLLEKAWAKYREENQLDIEGRNVGECQHRE